MRLCLAIALIATLAGMTSAGAADVPGSLGGGSHANYPVYGGMEPVIIYDSEPGVIVRTYWEPPWDNRHYFPKTGRRPKVGRLEHMPPRRLTRNESYYRYWSVSSFLLPDAPHGVPPYQIRPYGARPYQGPPYEMRPNQNQPNDAGPETGP